MSGNDTADAPRRVGRPSVRDQRQHEIVDAFIELVAVKGLEHVSLDDVAGAAKIQRTALRHFIGNRDELIAAAITEITRAALVDLDSRLSFTEIVNMLFDPSRMATFDVKDRAWGELLPEAIRSPETRAVTKENYDQLLALLSGALRQRCPNATRSRITDTAYAIACMAEHNYTFQRLGYARARCKGLRAAALVLADQLD